MIQIPLPPILLHYYITYRCNASCLFCEFGDHNRIQKTVDARVTQVAANLFAAKRLGVRFVDFTGGEPLLNSQLPQMLQIARKLRLRTSVTTNCKLYGKYGKKLKGLVNYLHFSLDAASAEKHDQVRGGKFFHDVQTSLEFARHLGETPDLLVTIYPGNLSELPKMIKFAQHLRLMLIVNPVFGNDNKLQLTDFDLQYIENFITEPFVYINRAFNRLRRQGGNNQNKPRCYAVSSTIVISPENKLLLPCYHYHQQQIPINGQLAKIWRSGVVTHAKKHQGCYDFCHGCTINCYFDPSFMYQVDSYFFESLAAKAKYVFDKHLRRHYKV